MKTTNPQEILDKHLRKALAPYAEQLRVEAELDRQLAQKAEALHPTVFEKEAALLVERAVAGDAVAEAELEAAGGAENYIKVRSAGYVMAENKRRYAAQACVPLWQKVAAAAIPAVSRAEQEIERQLAEVMAELGEMPPGQTQWGGRCRSLRHIFESAPRNAGEPIWFGAGYLCSQMGLDGLLAD